MREGDYLVGFDVIPSDNENIDLLIITNDGYGKRVKVSEFRVQGRGGLGLIAIKFKSPSSKMSCLTNIESKQEFMIATSNGVIVRQVAEDISQQGRMATGVRVQNMDANDSVVSVNKIVEIEESEIGEDNLNLLGEAASLGEDLDPIDDLVSMEDENL